MFSQLLVKIIEKFLRQRKISNQSTVNVGTFTVTIENLI